MLTFARFPNDGSGESLWGTDRAGVWPPRWWPEFETDGRGGRGVGLPLWIPTAACLLAAAAFWRTDAAHRRRLRTGLCPACGYDRAGLPAAAACPECNARFPPAATTSL